MNKKHMINMNLITEIILLKYFILFMLSFKRIDLNLNKKDKNEIKKNNQNILSLASI